MAKILIGTASWQEPDFIQHWYPPGLPKSELLPWYATRFNFVEVNGTFYGLPLPKTVEQWSRQTPDGFTFNVKLHRVLSRHATEPKFLPPDIRAKAEIANGRVRLTPETEALVCERFIGGIQPLVKSKKLGVLLLQLAPSFSPHLNALAELEGLLDRLAGFRVAIELRHRDWLSQDRSGETIQFLQRRRITLVSVDAPPQSTHFTVMPCLDFVTDSRLAYFRLHGRNEEAYVKGRTVQTRFDYDYSPEELIEFAQRVTGIADRVEAVHVVFNNNRHDFAPKAALALKKHFAEQAAEE